MAIDPTISQKAERNAVPETSIEEFVLAHPATDHAPHIPVQDDSPNPTEIHEAITSPIHLVSSLLARDQLFASSISWPTFAQDRQSITELITEDLADMLDKQCVVYVGFAIYVLMFC
jgi:hypothetical protein